MINQRTSGGLMSPEGYDAAALRLLSAEAQCASSNALLSCFSVYQEATSCSSNKITVQGVLFSHKKNWLQGRSGT